MASGTARPRNRERSKRLILEAALREFACHGHSGARVDRIAREAGVSKPLIYDYFGDKEAIYSAALEEVYVRIRQGEQALDLTSRPPETAIRELIQFTMDHYRRNPWFISMLATENLRGGQSIREVQHGENLQSALIEQLTDVLERGRRDGVFRADVDPEEFYVSIASLCYFPMSNMYTLSAMFDLTIDEAWLDRRTRQVADILLSYLRP